MQADAQSQSAQAAQRAAAAAASGMGFDNTVQSSTQGAAKPAVAQKALLGQ